MIDSMFLGIFAGMFSCLIALLLNYKFVHVRNVDPDPSNSLAKTCVYLLMVLLICVGAGLDYTIGSLAISVHTLLGFFAFVVADECVNSTLLGRFAAEGE